MFLKFFIVVLTFDFFVFRETKAVFFVT